MIISKNQMLNFRAVQKKKFLKKLVDYFTPNYPNHPLLNKLEDILDKTLRYHIIKELYVRDFIEFYFIHENFEDRLIKSRYLSLVESDEFEAEFKIAFLKENL